MKHLLLLLLVFAIAFVPTNDLVVAYDTEDLVCVLFVSRHSMYNVGYSILEQLSNVFNKRNVVLKMVAQNMFFKKIIILKMVECFLKNF